jgi:hypothetical protein
MVSPDTTIQSFMISLAHQLGTPLSLQTGCVRSMTMISIKLLSLK